MSEEAEELRKQLAEAQETIRGLETTIKHQAKNLEHAETQLFNADQACAEQSQALKRRAVRERELEQQVLIEREQLQKCRKELSDTKAKLRTTELDLAEANEYLEHAEDKLAELSRKSTKDSLPKASEVEAHAQQVKTDKQRKLVIEGILQSRDRGQKQAVFVFEFTPELMQELSVAGYRVYSKRGRVRNSPKLYRIVDWASQSDLVEEHKPVDEMTKEELLKELRYPDDLP